MGFNGYVQVPPDSTGKKVNHTLLIELDYNSGTQAFSIGDTVTGGTSGTYGAVVKINGTTATGELYLALSPESSIAFTVGENLTVNGITLAIAGTAGSTLYSSAVSIVDHENPFQGVDVSPQGELIVSPAEAPWTFEAFGAMRAKGENTIGIYHYNYGLDWGTVYPSSSNGATVGTGSYYAGAVLTNPVTDGATSLLESHLYHPYTPGIGQTWIGSIASGDSGKDNVIRRWGYYNDNDGLFFEQSGSAMSVIVRNNATGTIVETKISQSAWNGDKANGEGGEGNVSLATLTPNKGTVYFIDFQWLGVGRIRYGMIWSGRRVILHEISHNAELDVPYMATPALPSRIEQINSGTAGSISQLKCFSTAVIQATNKTMPYIDSKNGATNELTRTVDWTGSFRPLFSVRPRQTFLGKDNRSVSIPKYLQMYNEGAPIVFQVLKWPILTGDTWTVPTASYAVLDGDYTATTASGGVNILTDIIKPNDIHYHSFDTKDFDQSYHIHRKAKIDDANCAWTVVGKCLNTNQYPSSSVSIALDWLTIL